MNNKTTFIATHASLSEQGFTRITVDDIQAHSSLSSEEIWLVADEDDVAIAPNGVVTYCPAQNEPHKASQNIAEEA